MSRLKNIAVVATLAASALAGYPSIHTDTNGYPTYPRVCILDTGTNSIVTWIASPAKTNSGYVAQISGHSAVTVRPISAHHTFTRIPNGTHYLDVYAINSRGAGPVNRQFFNTPGVNGEFQCLG